MPLLRKVRGTIERHGLLATDDRIVVGVSGGPDSLSLLHLLWRLRGDYGLQLCVAHLNHGLRGVDADADADFVKSIAQEWGLVAFIERTDVAAIAKKHKLAIEEAARQARYSFLASVAREVGASKIAVGHNADDQVETVLMHWLRGSGLAGLRGMQPMSRLGDLRLKGEADTSAERQQLWLVRPLLEVPRSDIELYCKEHGLRPRFDRSNLDTTFYRNRLRHELIPFLETFNPCIRNVILRTSAIVAADHAYLRQQALRAWAEIVLSETDSAISFDLIQWRTLPLSLQRSMVREAIHRLRRSLRNINWTHVDNAIAVLRSGSTGQLATLPCGLLAALDYGRLTIRDEAHAEPLPDMPMLSDEQVPLQIPGSTVLPGSPWRLSADIVARETLPTRSLLSPETWQAFLDYGIVGSQLSLRTRRSGDRFCPQGLGPKATTVNGFMTNAKVPRPWRDRIPLLVELCPDRGPAPIWWVVGWRIDERAKVTEDTRRVLVLTFVKHDAEVG